MTLVARPEDAFTRDNIALGLPTIQFERRNPAGGFFAPIEFGILDSAALQKAVTVLPLRKGDTGVAATAREIISEITPSLQIGTYNFSANLAEIIFGSTDGVATLAQSGQAQTDRVEIPSGGAFGGLLNSGVTPTGVNGAPITNEAVGTGDGSSNAFSLDYKVEDLNDVSSITVGGVTYTVVGTGLAAAGNEVELEVGATATSGNLEFHVGGVATPPAAGTAILATYTPNWTAGNAQVIDPTAAGTDVVFDGFLGRFQVLSVDGAADVFRTGQPINVSYTFDRKAFVTLKPFTRLTVEGRATVRFLPDEGINWVWDIPSATIRLTDDDLSYGFDDFVIATLGVTINDAGGTARFGDYRLASEPQQKAA